MMSDDKFRKKLKKIKKQGERAKQEAEIRDAYSEYLPDKKKHKVSNIMLVISVIAIVSYVFAAFALQFATSVEISSAITTSWFAFWGGEIFLLAGIKISKVCHETNDV